MGFFGSLFGGANPTLNANIAKTGQIADWSTGQGEGDITAGTNFMKGILSGNSSDQMKVLSPEITAAKTSASESNKGNAIFGTRSGGTAASTAATSDKLHSDITNLIGSLTGKAADTLTSTGGNLLNTGVKTYGEQTDMSQQRMENWKNSLFGQDIKSANDLAMTAALGLMGG